MKKIVGSVPLKTQNIAQDKEGEMSIIEIVKNKWAVYTHYRNGKLFYDIVNEFGEVLYKLNINIDDKEDIGGATFEKRYKAIAFMRYIRMNIEDGSFITVAPKELGSVTCATNMGISKDLTVGKVYDIIAIEDCAGLLYRIVNDEGESHRYSPRFFVGGENDQTRV